MDALLPRSRPMGTALSCYERDPRSRRKQIGGVPRSFIRPQPSFFTDEEDAPRKVGRPKKKPKQRAITAENDQELERAVLQSLSEPPPNADMEFLRAQSHEAFIATPATIFSPKERKVLKDFVEDYFMTRPRGYIPLQAWNGIQAWQKTRKSRQLPIERSGFACKLWYELHDSPKLRLGAWTKQEDAALRRMASGEEDPKLVNQWEEIAKRMPIPGRPAVHCLARYQTALRADNVKSGFTPEEDKVLKEAVPVFGEKWNVIADLLDGRVPEQIRHRWQLTLAPGLRRGKFSIIEDRRLLLALRAYVAKDSEFNLDEVAWNDICHHLPGRTQPAVRDRYATCLNPDLSFRKFTKQEDQIILARVREWGVDAPRLWSRLTTELADRTDSQLARRWRHLDPQGYEKRRQAVEEASKAQTTAVFRRRSIHRRKPRLAQKNTSRISYNGLGLDEAAQAAVATASRPVSRTPVTNEPPAGEALEIRQAEGEDGWTEYML
ncbi:hypothetical protein PHYSODRAFT_492523 [Phytophthora sojae]|uniref:Uncharacterized protein n=1 Tax=Phytophthora sojae (strain P6497) TaxID=1094619 RepID=G4Z5M4_PHYSP|nr:hypothetical protein PHYSODRAFT_492523 [Phytophthora sojae]EGZ22338.1 hypothetical protein PHYSODRAFT_492523 [Phytophthora sojae]|eukprot:XP_009525055.1 hypothetical protein PHYSODRAFT_492523 [Phytophthora sojae]